MPKDHAEHISKPVYKASALGNSSQGQNYNRLYVEMITPITHTNIITWSLWLALQMIHQHLLEDLWHWFLYKESTKTIQKMNTQLLAPAIHCLFNSETIGTYYNWAQRIYDMNVCIWIHSLCSLVFASQKFDVFFVNK